MNTKTWNTPTVPWSRTVAPTHGFGMGEVCPQAGIDAAATRKRTLDAAQAIGSARMPWSPPE